DNCGKHVGCRLLMLSLLHDQEAHRRLKKRLSSRAPETRHRLSDQVPANTPQERSLQPLKFILRLAPSVPVARKLTGNRLPDDLIATSPLAPSSAAGVDDQALASEFL